MGDSKTICENCEEYGHAKRECMSLPKANLKAAIEKDVTSYEYQEPSSDIEIVDTHCHLDSVFERLRHQGTFQQFRAKHLPKNVKGCISSFSDVVNYSSFGIYERLLSEDRGVWGTFGIHPHCAKYYNDELEAKLISCLSLPRALAVGECGIDYSIRQNSPKGQQHKVFKRLLKLAVEMKKPVVVHCREAEADCFEIMKDVLPSIWHIHLHCYTGDMEQAKLYMAQFPNLYFGVTNLVTYATATQVHQNATDLPLRRLLLETDAPYFVPARLKSKWRLSHPGMLMYTAKRIAEFHNCSLDRVLEVCQRNAEHMYSLSF